MEYDVMRAEHAYLLGFLLGDGHLGRGRGQKGRLSVELHVRDAEHLEKLALHLPGSRLSFRTRTTNFSAGPYDSAVLSCSRLEVRQALVRLGMPEGRKGFTAAPPAAPFLERDFARGICDADGSLGFTSTSKPFVSLVTNSPPMADWWCAFLLRAVDVHRTWRPNLRDKAANVMVMMEPAAVLAAYLYQPGDLALTRKWDTAQRVKLWRRPPDMRRAYVIVRWTSEHDDVVRRGGRSYKEIA